MWQLNLKIWNEIHHKTKIEYLNTRHRGHKRVINLGRNWERPWEVEKERDGGFDRTQKEYHLDLEVLTFCAWRYSDRGSTTSASESTEASAKVLYVGKETCSWSVGLSGPDKMDKDLPWLRKQNKVVISKLSKLEIKTNVAACYLGVRVGWVSSNSSESSSPLAELLGLQRLKTWQ